MDFNLKRPCKTCPFLRGEKGPVRLVKARTAEIIHAATDEQGAMFSCHNTVDYGREDDLIEDEGSACHRDSTGESHCAGAILFSLKVGKPNQMTRIMGRIGGLRDLDQTADVFESEREMLRASLPERVTKIRRKRSA